MRSKERPRIVALFVSLEKFVSGSARLVPVPVTLRAGIVFSSVKPRLLLTEVGNFLRILAMQR